MANKKDTTDYANLTPDELKSQLIDTREKLFQLRFQNATAPLKNPREITAARRRIARLSTFLRQKGVRA